MAISDHKPAKLIVESVKQYKFRCPICDALNKEEWESWQEAHIAEECDDCGAKFRLDMNNETIEMTEEPPESWYAEEYPEED